MKFRSKFESTIASSYPDLEYETRRIKYEIPAVQHLYTPDFVLKTNSGKEIYIEAKGRYSPKDRKKMLLVRDQHPDLDIRFIFQNPNVTISKSSLTTVAEWCIKNNFKFGTVETIKKWRTE